MIEDLHEGTQETIRTHVPHKIPRLKHMHWWTPHLSTLWRTLKQQDRAQSRWRRRHPHDDLPMDVRQSYLPAKAHFIRAMKVAKHASWAGFLEEVNDGGPNQIWTNLKKMKTPSSPLVPLSLTAPDGTVVFDEYSVATMMLHKLCSDLHDVEDTCHEEMQTSNEALLQSHIPANTMEPITPEELHTCIRSHPKHAALRHDGLTMVFVLNSIIVLEPYFPAIFNASLKLVYAPKSWKRGLIVPLNKK